MGTPKVYRAIGLMSGTSLDGVDAAYIETDGQGFARPGGFVTIPYEPALREQIRACFGMRDKASAKAASQALTLEHARAVRALLQKIDKNASDVDIVGFHGQTIFHAPDERLTVQIGEGGWLARELGIDVIDDFRTSDVLAGGQGAPLAPLYHRARAQTDNLETPLAILNIGGVANVTWIGPGEEDILAFDTGPGNALIDDWVRLRTGALFDEDGKLAAQGKVDEEFLMEWRAHPYFKKSPPKSLDRDEWDIAALGRLARSMGGISTEDGAATLLAFTAESIIAAKKFLPAPSKAWYVCGGGRRNKALMQALQARIPARPVEVLGWDGDATEAECFAYLAVRSMKGLPLSLPQTTGVQWPQPGGAMHRAA
jgi:anhydro-N-acetylmuramic acid kinase